MAGGGRAAASMTASATPMPVAAAPEAAQESQAQFVDTSATDAGLPDIDLDGENREQKIIKSGYLSGNTDNFDGLSADITALVTEYAGYIENANIHVYDYDRNLKRGDYTLRVPSESYEAFKTALAGKFVVLSQSENVENLTTQYYDTESRLNTKRASEQRLLEMLTKAEKVEDLIALEQQLSEVRTEIELLENSLLNIDRLASYSTVTLSITEVREAELMPVADDLGSRMRGSFNSSINFITGTFESLVVLAAGLAVPLLLVAIPAVAAVLIVKTILKRRVK